jgi:hypothetical protein
MTASNLLPTKIRVRRPGAVLPHLTPHDAAHASTATQPQKTRLFYSRAEAVYQLSTSLRNIAYRIANGTLKVRRQDGRVLSELGRARILPAV